MKDDAPGVMPLQGMCWSQLSLLEAHFILMLAFGSSCPVACGQQPEKEHAGHGWAGQPQDCSWAC